EVERIGKTVGGIDAHHQRARSELGQLHAGGGREAGLAHASFAAIKQNSHAVVWMLWRGFRLSISASHCSLRMATMRARFSWAAFASIFSTDSPVPIRCATLLLSSLNSAYSVL